MYKTTTNLHQLSKEELIEYIHELQKKNFGLRQQVENLKEKEAKRYEQATFVTK